MTQTSNPPISGRRRPGGKAAPTYLPVSEAAFQQKVVDYAHLMGWRVMHSRANVPVVTKSGIRWMTPLQGDPGFPDLILVRQGDPVLFCELKAEGGRLSSAQKAWLDWLLRAAGEVRVWYPRDWPEIERALA